MTEAQEAISELLGALDEYGTTITLRKITQGAYNPATGSNAETATDTVMKVFMSASASESVTRTVQNDASINGFNHSIMLYHSEEPTTAWKVVYNGVVYNVTYVALYTLQNTIYKYELLIKK